MYSPETRRSTGTTARQERRRNREVDTEERERGMGLLILRRRNVGAPARSNTVGKGEAQAIDNELN